MPLVTGDCRKVRESGRSRVWHRKRASGSNQGKDETLLEVPCIECVWTFVYFGQYPGHWTGPAMAKSHEGSK